MKESLLSGLFLPNQFNIVNTNIEGQGGLRETKLIFLGQNIS